MAMILYHHPFSRAANVVWMLEEVGIEHELRFVDIMTGEQKSPEILALNPMGKIPILTDGDAVITESAAIGLYLADRYAGGRLAPPIDHPSRGAYLRWSLFAPSVIEPGTMAKTGGWAFKDGQAGWGSYDAMLNAMEHALKDGPFVLGDRFSMADIIFGGTVNYMLMFRMIEPRPTFTRYAEQLRARPAFQRALQRNATICDAHGIKRHG
jgi:glutathione S-transferase